MAWRGSTAISSILLDDVIFSAAIESAGLPGSALRVYREEGAEVVPEGEYEGGDAGEVIYTGEDGYGVFAVVEPAALDLVGDEYGWITVDAEDKVEKVEGEAEETVKLDAVELV